MPDISAVSQTATLNRYLKSRIDPIYRKSIVMAGLRAHGRIALDVQGGNELEWRPKIKRASIVASDPNAPNITFPSRNRRMKVTLPWKSYNLGEKITKFDRLKNKGSDVQYVKLQQEILDDLAEDFTDDFGAKFYADGSTAGSDDVHGMETLFSSSAVISGSHKVGNPAGTYAGKSTVLGDLGGSWSGDWPDGAGKHEYYAWSPLEVDYTNTSFSASTHTWAGQWQEVLNFATSYLGHLQRAEPDLALLAVDLITAAKDSLRDGERFIATPKSKLTDVGFKTISFENMELASEYDVPTGVGYVFSWDSIELQSMQKQLIAFEDDHVIETSDDLYAADFYGQYLFNAPSQFCKLLAIT